jgi:hypothetical protein
MGFHQDAIRPGPLPISRMGCAWIEPSSAPTLTVQNPCLSTSVTQQWSLAATSNGYVTLKNAGTGLVLDVLNGANTAGQRCQSNRCFNQAHAESTVALASGLLSRRRHGAAGKARGRASCRQVSLVAGCRQGRRLVATVEESWREYGAHPAYFRTALQHLHRNGLHRQWMLCRDRRLRSESGEASQAAWHVR